MRRRMIYFLKNPLPSVEARFRKASVRIWSGEHNAWWRANCRGYTIYSSAAGLYSFADALANTRHCGPEKRIFFETTAR